LRSGLSLDAAGSAYEPQPVMSSVVRASRKHRALLVFVTFLLFVFVLLFELEILY
jgi:hypothetical protein